MYVLKYQKSMNRLSKNNIVFSFVESDFSAIERLRRSEVVLYPCLAVTQQPDTGIYHSLNITSTDLGRKVEATDT